MKKIVLALAILSSMIACKKEVKEMPPVDTTVAMKVKDTIAIDYSKFGIDSTTIPKGLVVGEKAPDVTFTTADHKKVSLQEYYKKQPVVIIFYRGYWCPVCNKQLTEFAEKAKEIEAKGAKLIAISSESYENVAKTKDKTGANFTIISDGDESIMKAFGVDFKVTDAYQAAVKEHLGVSIAESNATKEAVLPVPATYIIDKDGKIVYKQFDPNYQVRASVEDIVAHLPR
ncbi:peroxiredoxin-like family protein [Flavobacterium sp. '19STA2R22 D10 B1']|uniref:peroxiredoxin-like family protein n=1 Tax=Flavobacterium aerium TaxID=3037261 RepID=UPI00278BCC87|nr:peroxiredoxin-like family protein [Flavobacterium sp. '19STA2R22 D10 B1']